MSTTGDRYWRITFDGQVYREVDLTIGQTERIEAVLATTWRTINPLRSATHAAGILRVLVADRTGCSEEEASAKIRAVKVAEFFDMVTTDSDDLPAMFENGNPPVADETSTST